MEIVLGVDIGTTSVKVVGFDADGVERCAAQRAYPLLEAGDGTAVQRPDQVIAATMSAIEAARSAVGAICGIGLSTAMHSLVGLDASDAPLTPLITWADNRASAQAQSLRQADPQLHAETGTPIHAMSPLAKLLWLKETQPSLFARARRWVGIKELILHRLTGEWVVDISCAGGMGLMSMHSLQWDREALRIAGVTADQLARIVPTVQVLPLQGDLAGMKEGTPVIAGAGDGPLANLGVGAVAPGVAACSIGTSGALRLTVPRPMIDPAGHLFCYALTAERWVIGGAINNGGSTLQWLRSVIAPELSEDELLELAADVPPGSEGLLMLPYLLSERAPHWSSTASGAYVGLRHFHGRGHLVRAGVEGVCMQLALVLASMQAAGASVEHVRATGGFARSAIWRQMLTDALDTPIGFTDRHRGSPYGAALLAMHALGLTSLDDASTLIQIEQTLLPQPPAASAYQDLLPLFERLYDDLMPAFEALAPKARPALTGASGTATGEDGPGRGEDGPGTVEAGQATGATGAPTRTSGTGSPQAMGHQ